MKQQVVSTGECEQLQNIMQWHLEKDNTVHLESLLRLLVLNTNANLSNIVSTIPEFQQLCSISSLAVSEFLRLSFVQNEGCRELFIMKWDSRLSQKCFGSNTSMLNRQYVEGMLKQAEGNVKQSKKF